MEVHHHPHVEKQKFKEYFFEFFMLFLAITLGFFVENLREHFSNKETEKQSIKSLVASLASDTMQLKNMIKANEKVLRHLDSLVQLRNADFTVEENKRAFLKHTIVGFSEDWYFIPNDAAMQQLKSSGTLRLIQNQNIIDSVFKYEANNTLLMRQQEDCYFTFKESSEDYKKAISLFFYRDTSVVQYSLGYDNSDIEIKNINPISISSDKEKINMLLAMQRGWLHQMKLIFI